MTCNILQGDALEMKLCDRCRVDGCLLNYGGKACENCRTAALVESIPAADVAPVVHARWVDGKCSNCGADIPTDDAHDAIFESECHYCYYCGAKMDGEA